MKKFSILALALVLAGTVMTGCRRNVPEETMHPSTHATTPSTHATTPSTHATTPSTHATTPSTHATTPSTHATNPSEHTTLPDGTNATEHSGAARRVLPRY